jgi:hypothetical protein
MRKFWLALAVLLGAFWAAPASATCTLPYQLQNGKISDANQVMANFNAIIACSAGSGVTWPAAGDVVISNTTQTPGGVAEVDGDCLIGSTGLWVAGSCSGAPCVSSSFAVQYNNAGSFGCAPMIVNSGVMDFSTATGPIWQIGGTTFYYRPYANFMCVGSAACANVSSNNGPMTCIGNAACGNVTSDGGDYVALGDQSCGDGASASGGLGLVCVGYRSGHTTSSSNSSDTYVGSQSGLYMNGSFNAALGDLACAGASGGSTGGNNTCLGHQAGTAVTSGSGNLFAGYIAGSSDTTGQFNVFVGYGAGGSVTTGSDDICIGFVPCGAEASITTGSRDIIIAAGNTNYSCLPSSASVNDEFDFCANGTGGGGEASPLERCKIASIASGNCVFNVPLAPGTYTVSTLPVSPPKGSRASVTDATACTFGASPTGGSSTFCPEVFDGSAWHGG